MEFDTVAKVTSALLRLVGTEEDDEALVINDEESGEVVQLLLTRGCRIAQRWMLECGYGGWRQRSSALSFTGADATDGGRHVDLPVDYMKGHGSQSRGRSALVQANGDRWGREIEEDQDHLTGDLYYVRGEELWLARQAHPPTTLYLDYHYKHPAWDDSLEDADIDFPLEARGLIAAEGAYLGMVENWLPGANDYMARIDLARKNERENARRVARRTKQPQTILRPRRTMSRY
ncbi:MAG: hypothetical protein AB7Q29_16010 [Vicinamibacterales bacterium]